MSHGTRKQCNFTYIHFRKAIFKKFQLLCSISLAYNMMQAEEFTYD